MNTSLPFQKEWNLFGKYNIYLFSLMREKELWTVCHRQLACFVKEWNGKFVRYKMTERHKFCHKRVSSTLRNEDSDWHLWLNDFRRLQNAFIAKQFNLIWSNFNVATVKTSLRLTKQFMWTGSQWHSFRGSSVSFFNGGRNPRFCGVTEGA